jgi:uncharacterized membrane protein
MDRDDMTKIKDILFRTILPTTIGTTILMGYFLIDDRLTPRQNIESCSDFYLSNTDYLIFTIVLAGLGSIFKLMTDKILKNKLTNSGTVKHVISILIFAFLLELIFLIAAVFNDKPSDILLQVLLIAIILGTIIKMLCLTVDTLIFKLDN